ncbi:Protein of unknown function [Pseudomonas helmanticensis]|uniref:Uncharacterized protein n=1 Tax=Pseudomonas helmanticensis TaxID=1471381 RepID=A0ACD2U729_9PSED|nr:Protein of unknown function [Pseudomonas helmanticensis]
MILAGNQMLLRMRIFIINIAGLLVRPVGRTIPFQGRNMKGKLATLPMSYRLAVTSRVLAAVFGGYLVAALASVTLTMWLPLSRAEAVVTGMTISFLVYLVAVLWCFACRTAWSAWVGLLVPSVILATVSGAARGLGFA